MIDLVNRINTQVIAQAEDIFEYFHVTPIFKVEEIPNQCGGNSELHVTFLYRAPHYIGKTKVFVYRPASQTQDGFVNEIRSYLLDCVDTFINV